MTRIKNFARQKKIFLVLFLVGVNLFLTVIVINRSSQVARGVGHYTQSNYEEVEELKGKSWGFDELAKYFNNLANKKSAAYAFEVLKRADLPPDTDMHLLGHVVGDELFKQQGLEGIKVCTHDFRNACSHSIVVGLFLQDGEAALERISEACRQAPGGKGAYTMCFHGLGHGVLAYTGYELERAVELCEKTGSDEFGGAEAPQCISGAVMEIIGGGFHDQELWQSQRPKYLKSEDPLYPCTADFMPESGRFLCLVYLTPQLFDLAGSKDSPTDKEFKTAFPYCDRLPPDDASGRDACYGGFGKEFIALAHKRDIRSIDKLSEQELQQVYKWCLLAGNQEGSAACMLHAMNSMYWGGENDRAGALNFCKIMDDPYFQKSCFMALIGAVDFYIDDGNYKSEFCNELPQGYDQECKTRLKLK